MKWVILATALLGGGGLFWFHRKGQKSLSLLAEKAKKEGWGVPELEAWLLEQGMTETQCRVLRPSLRRKIEGPPPSLWKVIRRGNE